MSGKRILLASSAFYPEKSPRSFRATELAKELIAQGHDVTLLTLPYGVDTDEYCRTHGINLKYVSARKLRPFPIHGIGLVTLFWRILNRLLLMTIEYPDIELMFAYKNALRREQGYDLLISFAVPYPVHWGVAWARTKNHRIGKTWVTDCGDPYVGNESDSFKKLFYFRFLELWMFRKADFITIPMIEAKPAYHAELQSKIHCIPQGVNMNELIRLKRNYVKNNVPNFAYAGSFILGKRDPRQLLEYLISLESDFRFIIYTTMGSMVAEYAARSAGRIQVKPYVPREQLIAELSQMDFLINIENSTTTQAPSKLIDYYLTDRPILSVSSSLTNQGMILQFFKQDYHNATVLKDIEGFKIENVARAFLNLNV
jgi:hypothetical protein